MSLTSRRPPPRVRRVATWILCAGVASLAGCREGAGPELSRMPMPAIVSDPVAPGAVAGSSTAAFSIVSSPGSAVVYVSQLPGTLPGQIATIRNVATGTTVTTDLIIGGFDPVPVPALAGDTLELVTRDATGAVVFTASAVVTAGRAPVVVRTDPPPRRRDVPLNLRIVVVFSEPIDPGTIDAGSVRLLQNGLPVAGTATLQGDGLRAEFVPAARLAPYTEYQLVVTQTITDLDGESLEAPVTVLFSTGSNAGRVAFSNNGVIYVMAADGSWISQVIDPAVVSGAYDPALSPDGAKIAFSGSYGGYGFSLYVVNTDGSGLTELPFGGTNPAWSPDGTRIALESGGAGGGIVVVTADGSKYDVVSDSGSAPAWSPDGTRIAFTKSYRVASPGYSDLYLSDIYLMNPDGSGVVRLISAGREPAWSPDGTRIAFSRSYDPTDAVHSSKSDIYLMNADGSGVTRLTYSSWTDDNDPAWSPDGRQLVFVVRDAIIVTSAEGVVYPDYSGTARLASGWAPSWSP